MNDSIDLLKEILKTEGWNLKFLYNLGCCYQFQAKYSRALKWYNIILEVINYTTDDMSKERLHDHLTPKKESNEFSVS